MPRRSSSSSSPSPSASRPSSRTFVPAPASPSHPTRPKEPSRPQHPGLLKQAAATGAGVAAGSVVGHVIGSALVGGRREQYPQQVQDNDPCATEIRAFLNCAQTQKDITLCEGFNEAIRLCRKTYGGGPQE